MVKEKQYRLLGSYESNAGTDTKPARITRSFSGEVRTLEGLAQIAGTHLEGFSGNINLGSSFAEPFRKQKVYGIFNKDDSDSKIWGLTAIGLPQDPSNALIYSLTIRLDKQPRGMILPLDAKQPNFFEGKLLFWQKVMNMPVEYFIPRLDKGVGLIYVYGLIHARIEEFISKIKERTNNPPENLLRADLSLAVF